jgi:MtrB/PioB family decaheme-associated outer membrane protein
MKKTAISVLIAFAAAGGAFAQESGQGLRVYGGVSAGLLGSSLRSDNAYKAKEYRDVEPGIITSVDVKGRSPDYYFDLFGENLGRDDMGVDIRGGKYGVFKYQLFDNRMVHNWTFGAKTPYSGIGSSTLTATLPNLNTATWNSFDYSKKRENLGGMFELWNGSPWFIRVDANEVREQGLQLIAGSNGTSPGNGFNDKPFPVDYTTRNVSLETGYATRQSQFSVSALHSRFSNDNDTLRWSNGFFGNLLDTSWLPPDNNYTKLAANGMLKRLPYASTLAGRMSYARTTNSIPIAATALSTSTAGGAGFYATNPSAGNFDGNIVHKTASFSLHSNPTRELDSRVYWNWIKKDNRSTEVTFTPVAAPAAANTNLACGGTACTTELLGYRKNNVGAEVGYRLSPHNRVIGGLDFVNLDRNRVDFDNTKDTRASLEWRNTTFDWLGSRVKYQHLQRRSHFLEGGSGASGADPLFLDRFIARFDASNVNQDLLKLGFDLQPRELLDFGFEAIFKRNNYKDTVLGRTKDDRQEFYASAAYGDINSFRVMVFGDVEYVKYDSLHRNISQLTPSGLVTADAIFNPFAAPQCTTAASGTCNYNWAATNRDRSWAIGVGTDWVPRDRLKLNASLIWQWTHGTADFSVQPLPVATNVLNPAVAPIGNFDNTRKVSLNLKGTYTVNRRFDVTTGFAHEKFRFSDIALDDYRYTIGTGTSTSHLSGAYAFPNYTLNVAYVAGTYKF